MSIVERQGTTRCRMAVAAGLLGCVAIGCATKNPLAIELMPAPDVYSVDDAARLWDPTDRPMEHALQSVLYATDRVSAGQAPPYYGNQRGHVLHLGEALVRLGNSNMTWEEARRVSLLKNRPGRYPLEITQVKEYGGLDRSLSFFLDPEQHPEDTEPAIRYADTINQQLETSRQPDIYIYVHGYKVSFASPVLVAAELWHFLGNDGVFIAYSWPATPRRTAYFKDLETTAYAVRNFRLFLEYLSAETEVRRIHIVGYSAGTRLVLATLNQLALIHKDRSPGDLSPRPRIGQVCILGSDVDRDLMAAYLVDGLLQIVDRLSVYQSPRDKALRLSRWFLRRKRVGQLKEGLRLQPEALEVLERGRLDVINVAGAADFDYGNGHSYFRSSPWVSSDVLMTLTHKLGPADRGLEKQGESIYWDFPSDYIDRLRGLLSEMLDESG